MRELGIRGLWVVVCEFDLEVVGSVEERYVMIRIVYGIGFMDSCVVMV